MKIKENEPLKPKTTMKIGGQARYYAEVKTKEDTELAVHFAQEKQIPLIVLGGGSNTIFADSLINALVVRILADQVKVEDKTVKVQAGKNFAALVIELATQGLDLSALTGVPGRTGGAVFGNAGQGPKGTWIDSFVEEVEVFVGGEWKKFSKDDCKFGYRESVFKELSKSADIPPIIWQVTLKIPTGDSNSIQETVDKIMHKRMENQVFLKTGGSFFKALSDGTPAWEVIEEAGLRGLKKGGIQISEKHANFLINTGEGSFKNVVEVASEVLDKVDEIGQVEMRLYGEEGNLVL